MSITTCCRESMVVIFSPLISALCRTLSGTGVNLVYLVKKIIIMIMHLCSAFSLKDSLYSETGHQPVKAPM